jgi:xanthine dehydrogenase iron-sulfur cluster and FAD-binding subunit A
MGELCRCRAWRNCGRAAAAAAGASERLSGRAAAMRRESMLRDGRALHRSNWGELVEVGWGRDAAVELRDASAGLARD